MGLAALEAKLDPGRFVRIHRRMIVAIDRVREIAALGAGDANLHLSDGTELRLSRTYRAAFLAARAIPTQDAAGAADPVRREGSLEVAPLQSYNS
jgi:DNA-binding LytR/AlgR family response regulator